MGSLINGSVKNLNSQSTPTVGGPVQQNWLSALFQTGMSPNPAGGWQFNGLPGYQGQLTPDLGAGMLNGSQNVSQGAWNSWTPQAPGMSGLQGNVNQANMLAQGNTQQGPLSFLSNYLGGSPYANPQYGGGVGAFSPYGGGNPMQQMMMGPTAPPKQSQGGMGSHAR